MSSQTHLKKIPLCDRVEDMEAVNLEEFEALLNYLKHHQGCDLSDYKRSTLRRRFQHRMQNIQIDTYQSYLQYLQEHSEEYLALLADVFINVTNFFRDRDAWDYLAAEIIPKIITSESSNDPIRVWSAGCATGQEIYSVLILLAEALGLEDCLQRVKCFATDADAAAIAQARQATYSDLEVADIPPDLLQKYFQQTEKGYVFHPELRRTVIFAQNNLLQDAPISKIDLLLCRNVLIYFNSDAQSSILSRFHFALKNTGFLFLGKAEVCVNHKPIFAPFSLKHHIYAKGLKLELKDFLAMNLKYRNQRRTDLLPIHNYFWEAVFENSPSAQLAIDTNGFLLHANAEARSLFGLTFNDCQRPFQELELAKLISSTTLAQTLKSQKRLTKLKEVEWKTGMGTKHFNIEISQVVATNNQWLGATLTFTFVEPSDRKQLMEELELTRAELTRVCGMLQSANSELGMVYEELETTQKESEFLHQEVDFI